MLSILEKESTIDQSLMMLSQLREDLRRRHKKSPYESYIPIICSMLNSIIKSEIQDHTVVDIFEGLPSWKNKETICEFRDDTVNFIE